LKTKKSERTYKRSLGLLRINIGSCIGHVPKDELVYGTYACSLERIDILSNPLYININ